MNRCRITCREIYLKVVDGADFYCKLHSRCDITDSGDVCPLRDADSMPTKLLCDQTMSCCSSPSRWCNLRNAAWNGFVGGVVALLGYPSPAAAEDAGVDQPAGANQEGSSLPYELVWADEFNTPGPPDARNWDFERGFVRNDELQWYQPANARCEGGLLVIEARRERVKNPRDEPGSRRRGSDRPFAEYTSASLHTRNRREWLYGRFVLRGRIDTRAGFWPAFWTLGLARRWPGCGEIDIMEYYDGKLLANAAWLGKRSGQPAWDESARPISKFPDPAWSEKFHVWRMDWDHAQIKLYVDDELLNTIDVEGAVNGGDDGDDDPERDHPFREPQYILLSLAVGGTHGGDPSATEFPARFEVDYVRVYGRQPGRGAVQP